MKARRLVLADYPLLVSWWAAWAWDAPAVQMLPNTGYLVETSDKPVLAGFLYTTDSQIGWVEWVIGNPEAKLLRKQALPCLLSALEAEARSRGLQVLFTSSNHPKLIEGYETSGFVKTDVAVTHLIKRLS